MGQEEISREHPLVSTRVMKLPPSISTSSSPPGAGLGIAFRWKKSSPIADGNERQPRSQAASSAFVTSF